MPVRKEQFEYLEEVVGHAEDLVRFRNPAFISGFQAIAMQSYRVECTIYRLQAVEVNLKEAEAILLNKIAGLRTANPDQKPKGTTHARRVLGDKLLWEKVVSAHAFNAEKENIDPNLYLSYGITPQLEEEGELSEALKNMSQGEAKIEFERHDFTLRHKLKGIKKITDLVTKYIDILKGRFYKLTYLEEVGMRWACRIFEEYDLEKVEKAQQLVVDSSKEVKDMIAVLDILPKDFTQLCELEDIGHGTKRKVDWGSEYENETPETMKINSCKSHVMQTRGKKVRINPVRMTRATADADTIV